MSVKVSSCAVYLVKAVGLGLVYVGIADDFARRWHQHRRQSWWLGEVVVYEVTVYLMETREAARQMEAAIIHTERPRYNTATEAGAFARYCAAADGIDDEPDPWPVAGVQVYDEVGEIQWSTL